MISLCCFYHLFCRLQVKSSIYKLPFVKSRLHKRLNFKGSSNLWLYLCKWSYNLGGVIDHWFRGEIFLFPQATVKLKYSCFNKISLFKTFGISIYEKESLEDLNFGDIFFFSVLFVCLLKLLFGCTNRFEQSAKWLT